MDYTTEQGRQQLADRVLYTTLGVNALLMLVKFAAGALGHSGAMLSDAVHTLSDVGTTVLVLIGLRISRKASDADHPYGHEKLEALTGLLLAAILALTALGIGGQGLRAIFGQTPPTIPTLLPLLTALLSIAVQEAMFHYARWGAKKIRSTAMMADAWHHRSDALSSVGSFIGIGGALLGWPVMDALASLVICALILLTAWRIGRDATRQLVDTAADAATQQRIEELILATPGVQHIDSLRTRQHGNRLYIDVEIALDHTLSFEEAHRTSELVHSTLETEMPDVLHCTVHANPHLGDGTPVD